MIFIGCTNKIYRIKIIFAVIIIVTVFIASSIIQYRGYRYNYNKRVEQVVGIVLEKYPKITQGELIELFTTEKPNNLDNRIWEKYGIDVDKEAIILENDILLRKNIVINIVIASLLSIMITIFALQYVHKRSVEIKRVTGYLEKINRGDYSLDMENMFEGEQSILENEVYKTTIHLKEMAERSTADKNQLKDSLSDISHQLKTPLTSMLINLENIQNALELDKDTVSRLIIKAKRDVNKMTKLVQQLLILSRFDANVIEFSKEKLELMKIVQTAIEDVEALADLKGVGVSYIVRDNNEDEQSLVQIEGDLYWETQAISNILKNAIEHANTFVKIEISDYGVYKEIEIVNDGEPIGEYDRKNIFKRFYQGEGAGKESVGIGLSLANAIVRQDGGYIIVDVDEHNLTKFRVRY